MVDGIGGSSKGGSRHAGGSGDVLCCSVEQVRICVSVEIWCEWFFST